MSGGLRERTGEGENRKSGQREKQEREEEGDRRIVDESCKFS